MKPVDLVDMKASFRYNNKIDIDVCARAHVRYSIAKYIYQDCVLGYYKCPLGCCFVIQTKKKFKAYFYVKEVDSGYNLFERYVQEVIPIIINNGTVVEKEKWDKMAMMVLAENI